LGLENVIGNEKYEVELSGIAYAELKALLEVPPFLRDRTAELTWQLDLRRHWEEAFAGSEMTQPTATNTRRPFIREENGASWATGRGRDGRRSSREGISDSAEAEWSLPDEQHHTSCEKCSEALSTPFDQHQRSIGSACEVIRSVRALLFRAPPDQG
jgi:hypothetical protein